MGWMDCEIGLDRLEANYVPLTPLSHLNRAREVYPDREALVYGSRRYDYRQYHERVTRLASSLAARNVQGGDVVSTILPNVPAAVETHFAVPACGAVLNAINVRLDVSTVSFIFDHAEPKIVIVDTRFLPLAVSAAESMEGAPPEIIEVSDGEAGIEATGQHTEYEQLISEGDAEFNWTMPSDEWESLTLNYTSGTTGLPKGVVYHHRGAYLMTLGTVISWRMTLYPRLMTIVPLFHCNGWNHAWLMPAMGGTVVCCRDVTAKAIYDSIADEKVTHFGGAPIVLNMIANADDSERREFNHMVEVFTAGAPPPAATLEKVERLNFNVTHVYGLTESYGHVTECIWRDEWNECDATKRATLKARQGVLFPMMERVTVVDSETRREVPRDGVTQGEVVMRGNAVMKGYYKNSHATVEAFEGGSFRSGDIAVLHPDGYIQIVDRTKDIIISGGENVSSVEVEGVLMHHHAVSLCAVVAKPDEQWGEVPFAYVELIEGKQCTADELIAFCRESLAGFKVPKGIEFRDLPKTATGKIQKFELREDVKSLG